MTLELIHNIALLVSLSVGFEILSSRMAAVPVLYRLTQGLMFGVVGVVGMMTPLHFAPGVIYDGRSIVLSLAGLFGGPVAAVVAAVICGAYRLFLGGAGAPVGVAVVVEAALLGVGLHYLRRRSERWVNPLSLWLFALLVHAVMLALQLWIPGGVGLRAVERIGLVVMGFYPLGFLLISMVFLEVERRRRHEQDLRARKMHYRALFENNHAVMLLIDPTDGRLLDANPAACAFYGYPRERIQRMHLSDIKALPPAEIQSTMTRALEDEQHQFSFQHRLADGSLRDVEVVHGPVQLGGRNLLYAIVHDVTARKKAEADRERLQAQLIQAQKMEAVGLLAGGVAHDFNNMLQGILGYSDMALQEAPAGSSLHDYLTEIQKAGRRAADLTHQLLAFARRQPIAPRQMNLNESVAQLLRMLERLMGEDIDLVWKPAEDLWPVNADPTQIDQILTNLCANARDAISSVGKVTIETANVVFDEHYCADHPGFVPGEFVMLAVSDDGRGMDEETLNRVFEPFFTTKKLGQGTGLGLATVYGIVKQNQGFINVYSEPNKGTTVKVYLPRFAGAAAQVQPVQDRDAPVPAGRGETILMVEDDAAILQLGRRMLEKWGYRVLSASSPQEALDLVAAYSGDIHLLITDVVMPGMNGRELADRLQVMRPAMRCLFMSGWTSNVIVHRGVLNGGVQFLQKPFSSKELAAKVREALDSRP
ncbi:MAG: hypothetical protein Kow0059_00900 [Candidatus Sumerlaeia bacterium]